jgi:hypothetical protein
MFVKADVEVTADDVAVVVDALRPSAGRAGNIDLVYRPVRIHQEAVADAVGADVVAYDLVLVVHALDQVAGRQIESLKRAAHGANEAQRATIRSAGDLAEIVDGNRRERCRTIHCHSREISVVVDKGLATCNSDDYAGVVYAGCRSSCLLRDRGDIAGRADVGVALVERLFIAADNYVGIVDAESGADRRRSHVEIR